LQNEDIDVRISGPSLPPLENVIETADDNLVDEDEGEKSF
ncbi:961_t:CDS:2, partial [Paraglomus occultum]